MSSGKGACFEALRGFGFDEARKEFSLNPSLIQPLI
jgi:hypothetical protein